MKRGEIWIGAGGGTYASRPRPVVILQDERFDAMDSIIVCPFTTDPPKLPLFRLEVSPDPENGSLAPCSLMVDKISAVPRRKLDARIGVLSAADMMRVTHGLLLFLGMAGAAPDQVEAYTNPR